MVRIFVEISKIMSEHQMERQIRATKWKLKQQKVFTLFFSGVCYNNIIIQAYQIQERESDERSKRYMAVF